MGNNSSQQGVIHIRTDKACYWAGETVTGNVYLWLPEKFSGNSLVLTIKGKEKIGIPIGRPAARNKPSNQGNEQNQGQKPPKDLANKQSQPPADSPKEFQEEKLNFFNHRIQLGKWADSIPAGQYSFPFVLPLHSTLPGSFSVDCPEFKGMIKYTLKAELDTWNKKEKPIKKTCSLVIREVIDAGATMRCEEMRINVSTWGCINQGSCYMSCHFDRNAYAAGDKANIYTELDNSICNLPIKNVHLVLKSKITLRDKSGKQLTEKTETIATGALGGLGAHQTSLRDSVLPYPIALVTGQNKTPVHSSANGALITSSFVTEVKAEMAGCTFCAPGPHVELPITILAPVAQMETFTPPQNWKPQTMPQVTGNLKECFLSQANRPVGLNGGMAGPGGQGGMANVQINLTQAGAGAEAGGGGYVNMDYAKMN